MDCNFVIDVSPQESRERRELNTAIANISFEITRRLLSPVFITSKPFILYQQDLMVISTGVFVVKARFNHRYYCLQVVGLAINQPSKITTTKGIPKSYPFFISSAIFFQLFALVSLFIFLWDKYVKEVSYYTSIRLIFALFLHFLGILLMTSVCQGKGLNRPAFLSLPLIASRTHSADNDHLILAGTTRVSSQFPSRVLVVMNMSEYIVLPTWVVNRMTCPFWTQIKDVYFR